MLGVLHQLGDDLVLLGQLGFLLNEGRFELRDLPVLGVGHLLGGSARLSLEGGGAVLKLKWPPKPGQSVKIETPPLLGRLSRRIQDGEDQATVWLGVQADGGRIQIRPRPAESCDAAGDSCKKRGRSSTQCLSE